MTLCSVLPFPPLQRNPSQYFSIPESSRNGWRCWEKKMCQSIQHTPLERPKVLSFTRKLKMLKSLEGYSVILIHLQLSIIWELKILMHLMLQEQSMFKRGVEYENHSKSFNNTFSSSINSFKTFQLSILTSFKEYLCQINVGCWSRG